MYFISVDQDFKSDLEFWIAPFFLEAEDHNLSQMSNLK